MKLPIISGKALAKALSNLGYETDHQTGSHLILRKNVYPYDRITIPLHAEIAKGTLRAIMRQVGIETETLLLLLGKKKQ